MIDNNILSGNCSKIQLPSPKIMPVTSEFAHICLYKVTHNLSAKHGFISQTSPISSIPRTLQFNDNGKRNICIATVRKHHKLRFHVMISWNLSENSKPSSHPSHLPSPTITRCRLVHAYLFNNNNFTLQLIAIITDHYPFISNIIAPTTVWLGSVITHSILSKNSQYKNS